MRVAFYAPMKPPNHTVASGDRTIARNLMAALEYTGINVTLASDFCCRDGKGDAETQKRLIAAAKNETMRVLRDAGDNPFDLWVTYHNYYKAPDLVGPAVCDALEIPYVQIESTRAQKRLGGPWDLFAKAAEAAAERAQLIFYFTQRDASALEAYRPTGQKLCHLQPFLNQLDLACAPPPDAGRILSVGMMRHHDKLPSYQIIAETLTLLPQDDWALDIIGDGPARSEVAAVMAPFGNRVTFLGARSADDMAEAYGNAGLFLWPGVNEAIGMTYVEAQVHGLAIVAQDRPGLRDVLPAGTYPTPDAGPAALAEVLNTLLTDPDARRRAQQASRLNAKANHLLPQAAQTLLQGFTDIGVPHA